MMPPDEPLNRLSVYLPKPIPMAERSDSLVPEITVQELKDLLDDHQHAFILDVRQ